ncbi:hypothetical protein G7Y89_g601 [Cudoniella acicularis]|uniref:ABC transporter domain-containing protein n=1 Tax=Cudoniella acicularis TaxID=354080 RepID=A0A8H4RYV5_9HELO|nr:hypothetical protein G7Y89_g601 [Cudoniella acicularis]
MQSATCFPRDNYTKTLGLTILITILDILSDILIASIPILILKKSQMKLSQKMSLALFLCLSIVMALFALARCAGIKDGSDIDYMWEMYWQYMEGCIACIMASITPFRTLFTSLLSRSSREKAGPPSNTFIEHILKRRKKANSQDWIEMNDQQSLPRPPGALLSGLRTFRLCVLVAILSIFGPLNTTMDSIPNERPPNCDEDVIESLIDLETGFPSVSTSFHHEIFAQAIDEKYGGSLRRCASLACQNVNVYGYGSSTDYQKTFANYPIAKLGDVANFVTGKPGSKTEIIHNFDGLVEAGQMLLVLGRPGSGCSTLLKTLAGQTDGFEVSQKSVINYQGIPMKTMHSEFRGECTYHAESDVHFPHLTVGQTLELPAQARAPRLVLNSNEIKRAAYARESKDATLLALNLSSAVDTKIGNEFVQGVSGGQRKRASIAEIMVGDSPFQCWDNSTRGLDSANAFEFLKALRESTRKKGSIAIVTLYQASQDMYDTFDKITLLYEGHQVFFGNPWDAKDYFVKLGFICAERTTTGNFLTSITNPVARITAEETSARFLRSSRDFADTWDRSKQKQHLLKEIKVYHEKFPVSSTELAQFRTIRRAQKQLLIRRGSPYTVDIFKQIRICVVRGIQVIRNDFAPPISNIIGNVIMSVILGSMFFNMSETTDSFFGRSVLLFFTILLNTFLGAFEGVALWEKRAVVEKHFRLALYHPAAEAISSLLCDLPNKFLLTLGFNLPFYFMANLRRTPTAFFTFYLFAFVGLVTGSMIFRTIGAMSRTLTSSIAPGAIFILMLVIYSGFVIPVTDMHPWLRWFAYIDPVSYAFESLMINEACSETQLTFCYSAAEYIPLQGSKGEVLLFPRGHIAIGADPTDEESEIIHERYPGVQERKNMEEFEAIMEYPPPSPDANVSFLWKDITYDISTSQGPKRILNGIQGWIQPGSLTVVMGCSGAGKTTLLNVLAKRAPQGVIGGEAVIGAQHKGEHSFARKVGYAQQNDIHLSTSTVREALELSAQLRQSRRFSTIERKAYVDEIVRILDMAAFVDAIIGIPGEGLNVEQRKKVTIGVELAARPDLLTFLDEPTSGLDSNTAWAICTLLRRLANGGQAILCTIHQPSGDLFQMFDRLLLLAEDGRQIYFGDIGYQSSTLIEYFERHGARKCRDHENPAEWLLEITSAEGHAAVLDWSNIWQRSREKQKNDQQLENFKDSLENPSVPMEHNTDGETEFATDFLTQLKLLTKRNIVHDWRMPSYLYSKFFLALGGAFLNGVSFWHSQNNIQGVQNQIFSAFLIMTLYGSIVQLIIPQYFENRELYEIRERPSKLYSWPAFILSNFIAEIPWQTIMAVLIFIAWYFPIGFSLHMTQEDVNSRSALVFLFIWSFMMWSLTFSQMVVTALPSAALGVNIASLLHSLSLIFCGVLVPPSALPHFWIWMVRVTPLTYFVGGIISTGIGNSEISCSSKELVSFRPPTGLTCQEYLAEYMSYAGGNLLDPTAQDTCQLCPASSTDALLSALGIFYSERWRNFGISLVFSVFNVLGTLLLYWLFRLPKRTGRSNSSK